MKTGLMVLVALIIVVVILGFISGINHGHMWGSEGRMDFGHGVGYMWILLLIVIAIAVYLVIESQRPKLTVTKRPLWRF